MGICSSCESTSVATTAKLISHDGRLHEFSYPVKVSYVLQNNPSTFICNSDEMDFHDVVSPISDDEELQLGQLYFALPLSRLRRRLQPDEMAALAVKASAALANCRRKNVSLFTTNVLVGEKCCTKSSGRVADARVFSTRTGRGSGDGGGGGRRPNFMALWSVIPE